MKLEVQNLDTLLRRAIGPSARCDGIEVLGQSSAGENYGSTFLKLQATVVDDTHQKDKQQYYLPMVAKKLPDSEFLRDAFNVDVTFVKEVQFYKTVVPAFEALESEVGIDPSLRLDMFPKLYGATTGTVPGEGVTDDAIIVLEDLCSKGFRTGSRVSGLDLVHCKLAVRELARFHALGIALKVKKPDLFWGPVKEAAVFFMHTKTDDALDELYSGYQLHALDLLEADMPELAAKYMPRLRPAIHRGRYIVSKREPFCTLLHGDFWVNNMMFAYEEDDQTPAKLKLVDFQITNLGSPVIDLYFFLYTSTASDAYAHLDELVREYHAELVLRLKIYGLHSDKYDWDAFQEEIKREVPKIIWLIFFMIRIIRAEKSKDNGCIDVNASFKELALSDSARTRTQEMIEDWDRRGLI